LKVRGADKGKKEEIRQGDVEGKGTRLLGSWGATLGNDVRGKGKRNSLKKQKKKKKIENSVPVDRETQNRSTSRQPGKIHERMSCKKEWRALVVVRKKLGWPKLEARGDLEEGSCADYPC